MAGLKKTNGANTGIFTYSIQNGSLLKLKAEQFQLGAISDRGEIETSHLCYYYYLVYTFKMRYGINYGLLPQSFEFPHKTNFLIHPKSPHLSLFKS